MRKSFSARCRLQRRKPQQQLTPDERREAAAQKYPRIFNREYNRGKGRWEIAFPTCPGFETTDAALFDAHMAEHHGAAKPRASKFKVPRWRGPRLTEAGVPFEPAGLEPGASVTWRELVPTGESFTQSTPEHGTRTVEEREWVERSGQVWSAASAPKSAWVIPFEKRDGELAVCVQQDRTSDLRHHSTWTTNGYRDAA